MSESITELERAIEAVQRIRSEYHVLREQHGRRLKSWADTNQHQILRQAVTEIEACSAVEGALVKVLLMMYQSKEENHGLEGSPPEGG